MLVVGGFVRWSLVLGALSAQMENFHLNFVCAFMLGLSSIIELWSLFY